MARINYPDDQLPQTLDEQLDLILDNFMQGLVVSDATGYTVPGTLFKYIAPAKNSLEAKAQLKTLIAEQMAVELEAIKEEMKMHTVPEGQGLITRSYLNNTIDFKIKALKNSPGGEG